MRFIIAKHYFKHKYNTMKKFNSKDHVAIANNNTKVFYKVVVQKPFCDMIAYSLEEAKELQNNIGRINDSMSADNIVYWLNAKENSKIVKVIETIKEIY